MRAAAAGLRRVLAVRPDKLAAPIEGARVLVADCSAAAPLTAALGTPAVEPYALTNPQHTPWCVASRVLHHDAPCRRCLKSVCPEGHHDGLRRVPPERAVLAAIELMNRPVRGPTQTAKATERTAP